MLNFYSQENFNENFLQIVDNIEKSNFVELPLTIFQTKNIPGSKNFFTNKGALTEAAAFVNETKGRNLVKIVIPVSKSEYYKINPLYFPIVVSKNREIEQNFLLESKDQVERSLLQSHALYGCKIIILFESQNKDSNEYIPK
jgi:hypothetical protein